MTSVFQGLCLSRSMGRVGENPGYEVADQFAVHCTLKLSKSRAEKHEIRYRKLIFFFLSVVDSN